MTALRDNLDVLLAEAVRLAPRRPPLPGEQEPPDELLLRLLDADMPPREREEARQRISRSAYASERLAVLMESLAETDGEEAAPRPAPDRSLRLSFLLAADRLHFLFGSLLPRSLVTMPVATRGSAPDATEESSFFDFVHRFEDLEAQIFVERVSGGRLDLQLQFQFQGEAARARSLRVSLSDRNGALLDSQPVERGMVRFASLPPSSHLISITDARRERGLIFLDVHPA